MVLDHRDKPNDGVARSPDLEDDHWNKEFVAVRRREEADAIYEFWKQSANVKSESNCHCSFFMGMLVKCREHLISGEFVC